MGGKSRASWPGQELDIISGYRVTMQKISHMPLHGEGDVIKEITFLKANPALTAVRGKWAGFRELQEEISHGEAAPKGSGRKPWLSSSGA